MSWLALALIGHISNGIAFVIDKALLTTAFKRSATYAALIGTMSFAVVLAIPWIHNWPSVHLLPYLIGFGALFVFALWAFFEALKQGEATRVVPIIGSLIPIMTLIGTFILFGERLSLRQYIGFCVLLIATWLLTKGKPTSRITKDIFITCVASAVLFAGATLCGKYAFDHGDFLSVFVSSRLIAGSVGLGIALCIPAVGSEILRIFHPSNGEQRIKKSGTFAVLGQIAGSLGFVFIHLAIKSGSAALVHALQAVQYAFLVIVALVLYRRAPQLLGEDVNIHIVVLKCVALVCTGIGLGLII